MHQNNHMNFFEKIYIKSIIAKSKIKTSMKFMDDSEKNIYHKCLTTVTVALGVFVLGYFLLGNTFSAYTIDISGMEAGFKNAFNQIYKAVASSSSIIAATLVAYNITMIMTSKNQRKISDSFTWIKGIAMAWLCLMMTGWFIKLIIAGFGVVKGSEPILHG